MKITITIEGKRASVVVETDADLVEAEPVGVAAPGPYRDPPSDPTRPGGYAEP